MKDKEKQIEEMARDVRVGLEYGTYSHFDTRTKDRILTGYRFYETAKILYEYGYRKLSKDSVVLSWEEYGKYQNLKRDVEHSFEYNQGYTDGQIKGSKETAEKILYFMKAFFDSWEDTDKVSKITMIGYLKAVAREFEVEIKE
jgi:hypothetical protein